MALMEWLMQTYGCAVTLSTCHNAATHSAATSNVATLKWLKERGHLVRHPSVYVSLFGPPVPNAGSMVTMKWLNEETDLPFAEVMLGWRTAGSGSLEGLQYVHRNALFPRHILPGHMREQWRLARNNGHQHIIEWLRTQGAPEPPPDVPPVVPVAPVLAPVLVPIMML